MSDTNEERGPSIHQDIVQDIVLAAAIVAIVVAVLWLFIVFGVSHFGSLPVSDAGRTDGIYAQNRTSQDLHFRVRLQGGWYNVPGVAQPYVGNPYGSNLPLAGPDQLDANGCTSGPMVALTDDDREFARHDAPLCLDEDGQVIWVIEGPASSPSD